MSRFSLLAALTLLILLTTTTPAAGQITVPRSLSSTPDRIASLEEQLINRLRATRNEQKAFIKFVIKNVREERLELPLVLATQKKAIQRNRFFPFPFFERAMRFQADKRNVWLPPVQQFATTRILPNTPR